MRTAGRYNLASLGWKSFEDLCRQVLRVVLGETLVGFGQGGDGGRDAFYTGTPTGKLKEQHGAASFIVQCKHTSLQSAALVLSTIKPELPKLAALAARCKPVTYVLLTNRRATADSESEIREAVLNVDGVESLLILNEEWLEDTIDSEPRLLRLVPRLYGVGDLTQILSYPIGQQSRALLEALIPTLTTFVPTESYRAAEKLLTERRMVVLVGPPASGKSTIAANLCTVWAAQTVGMRAFRLDKAEHFASAWSPDDPASIYWVDDIFGETTLDDDLLRDWSRCLNRLHLAAAKGARVVVGTRDYILAAADERLKVEKSQLLRDASVRVRVDNLTSAERRRILYNHIKHGDLPKEQKQALKRFLPQLAELQSFTPELARRLGASRFHGNIELSHLGLRAFFDKPVDFFAETMAALAPAEIAALSACLLSNNSLPDPVPEGAVPRAVTESYGVSISDIRLALGRLEGTFTRRQPGSSGNTWRLHHPSMVDALQARLRSNTAYFELYIRGAELNALLRDTSTQASPRLLEVPPHLHELLLARLVTAGASDEVGRYIVERGSSAFLLLVHSQAPELLNLLLDTPAEPGQPDHAAELGRLMMRAGLLRQPQRDALWSRSEEMFRTSGAIGFLSVEDAPELLGEARLRAMLAADRDQGFPSLARLADDAIDAMHTQNDAEYAREVLIEYEYSVIAACEELGVLDDERVTELRFLVERAQARVLDRASEIEDEQSQGEDYDHDYYKEIWREERYELEHGLFSDVDE